jgi:hypothetical protein
MPISFHASNGLPHTVVAVLAQHHDRTVVLLNHTLVELMSPLQWMDSLNGLFAQVGEPPTLGRLDELAAPRRERSRRTHENYRQTELSTSQGTELGHLEHAGNSDPEAGGE